MMFLRDAVSLTEIARSYYTPRSTQICVWDITFACHLSYINREYISNYDESDASNGVHILAERDPSSISYPLYLRAISSSSVVLTSCGKASYAKSIERMPLARDQIYAPRKVSHRPTKPRFHV